jgi:DNA-binding NarL/FixJ family response regulator
MNRRLLFVDDDPLVLDGLRRALHGMRQTWEMNFVSSADAALQALEKDHYDGVVTDMRMPGMDGAQLLEQIKQRYPDVVRMILSGQSSREAVYRSISPAHQFLSKPCNPQELMARLGEAFSMRDLLANQSLKTMISRLRSIPSLPTLYNEITAALRSEVLRSIRSPGSFLRMSPWPPRFCNCRTPPLSDPVDESPAWCTPYR